VETLKRFERMTLLFSLALTLVVSGGGYVYSAPLGKGLLLGGVAGMLVFCLHARAMRRLADAPAKGVLSAPSAWTWMGWAVYAAVLIKAHGADPDRLHAFWGAAGGLMFVRIAAVFLGVTGLDLRAEGAEGANGRNR